ncbi:glycoside hydrolase superfamily [Geopyxis carbonaria]|nr:glycoside hydrolase superfamily [Geopyxis carbonaria]
MIFETASWIDVTREVVRITLPTPTRNTLHIFAATLLGPTGPGLEIQHARSTRKWVEGSEKWQVVEVLVNNVDAARWVHGKGVEVTVTGPGVRTVQPGRIWRLRPGDQARVQVAVVNRAGVPAGATGPATVVLKGPGVERRHVFSAVYGIPQYAPTLDSVLQHETPAWYDDAKFGVFIHWGVYSVPGWGNVGDKEVYAEWYWWNMNKGPGTKDDTWQYHLDTYGADVVYDDFIQNFTADKYDPKEWVDLFNEAGAKYFVSVISKHHDGYALFDLPASVSKRTSVALPPHRNLLKELFDASTTHHPHLRRATYYSLPEWFNPSYTPYGFRLWPGGLAHSPYTNATLPYTGHVAPGANASYLTTLLLPSLTALAALGTDLLWCDIGGPNLTVPFAASWFNAAAAAGRQVALNDRCGIPGDFSTPEYARYDTTTRAKWEANRGLDPYSYGFNRATPRGAYMNASTIILTLLDVISKGGNLLLDIGPRADGTIVEAQSEALRGAGKWIGDGHAEGVYGTAYWFVQPQEGAARFVHTQRAFYVWLLERPEAVVRIWAPVPWRPGDGVVVVGGGMAGTVLDAERVDGVLEIRVPEEVAAAETVAWGVKIVYGTE